DHDLLAAMSPDAFVVNGGRGGIADETALLHALRAERIAGAALDVFETEPLPPSSPLWTAPNLTVTPHVAGLGEDYVEKCIVVLIDNARRLDRGQPRHHLVDRTTNY
ncbi:MAG: D-2-hydroxyacid dehydrogenase, partial [Proteobacteria bacterium]|nr:D-2-hydroxyacid dehydrogenase [Pseudomonadota bacterium]